MEVVGHIPLKSSVLQLTLSQCSYNGTKPAAALDMSSFQTLKFCILSTILIGLSATGRADTIVFNNTTHASGPLTFTALQIGNEIEIAGGAQRISRLEIGVNQQGVSGTANLEAFLYANNGAAGAPGDLLWHSSIMNNVPLTGGNDLIPFDVPAIQVPAQFTWAIQISGATPIAAGVPSFDPPDLGVIDQGWFGAPGSWVSLASLGNTGHFMARVTAATATVPETGSLTIPAAFVFLAICIVGRNARSRARSPA